MIAVWGRGGHRLKRTLKRTRTWRSSTTPFPYTTRHLSLSRPPRNTPYTPFSSPCKTASTPPPSAFILSAFNMALSSVISRHPRYSTLLVVVLLAAAFLLFPSHPSMPLNRISDVEYFKSKSGGRSLKAALRDEEMRYQKVLADREAMVRKWGPTADRVLA